MLEAISKMARPAAEKIKKQQFVRVVSHHDADGITACGIICLALQRQGIPFQATIVSNLDTSVEAVLDPAVPVIFCDMGSGQPDIVNKFDAVIIDHHVPNGTHVNIMVNPHLAGIDGGSEMSASGVAYAVAREMGNNVDLAGLAISGAIGDKQRMVGPNKDILEEGLKNGVISVQKGLKLGMGPVEKVLEYSIDPYFDFSGKHEATEKFVKELGLGGNIENLSHEDLKRLGSALSLLLLKKSPPDTIDSLFGDVYLLKPRAHPRRVRFHQHRQLLRQDGAARAGAVRVPALRAGAEGRGGEAVRLFRADTRTRWTRPSATSGR